MAAVGFTLVDYVALAWFAAAWLAYYVANERTEAGRRSMNRIMNAHRYMWMRRLQGRDNRIIDANINATLQNGSAFFASTSLLAIGGGLAALRASDQAIQVFSTLPFGIETTTQIYDIKALGFSAIFVYAFFKFVWAYRLFNYCSILIVSAPPPSALGTQEMDEAIERAARMNIEAGKHFNRGLRALFFVLAYLGWFVNPWVLIAASLIVLIVLYRRQFDSEPLRAASHGD